MTLYQIDETTLSTLLLTVMIVTFTMTLLTSALYDAAVQFALWFMRSRGLFHTGKRKAGKRTIGATPADLPVTLGSTS